MAGRCPREVDIGPLAVASAGLPGVACSQIDALDTEAIGCSTTEASGTKSIVRNRHWCALPQPTGGVVQAIATARTRAPLSTASCLRQRSNPLRRAGDNAVVRQHFCRPSTGSPTASGQRLGERSSHQSRYPIWRSVQTSTSRLRRDRVPLQTVWLLSLPARIFGLRWCHGLALG